MTKKETDYIQVDGLVDHRPFIVPGMLNWMQAVADPVHISFLRDFPGVEGTQGVRFSEQEFPVLRKDGDEWKQYTRKFNLVTFNFASSAISGYFSNDQGVGCMMRFSGNARSIFIPYAAMLVLHCPNGVNHAEIMGYDRDVGRGLLTVITPGMIEAMDGKSPIPDTPPAPPAAEEQPKPRPSHLRRVQ